MLWQISSQKNIAKLSGPGNVVADMPSLGAAPVRRGFFPWCPVSPVSLKRRRCVKHLTYRLSVEIFTPRISAALP